MNFEHQNRRRVSAVAALVCTSLLTGCQTTGGGTGDVSNTWRFGMHRVPKASLRAGQFTGLTEIRENPDGWTRQVAAVKLKPGTKLPTVIYLHGCAGNTAGGAWARTFDQMGYAFFAPDSFARPRRSLCGAGQMETYRIPMRIEELRHAREQLRRLSWIDQDRVVLMGSSEGAQAASNYAGRDFAAIVLSATDCRFSGGSPSAPRDIPVLSMVGSRDTQGGGSGCSITRTASGSRKVVIEGGLHKLANEPAAKKALMTFLRTCCATAR